MLNKFQDQVGKIINRNEQKMYLKIKHLLLHEAIISERGSTVRFHQRNIKCLLGCPQVTSATDGRKSTQTQTRKDGYPSNIRKNPQILSQG